MADTDRIRFSCELDITGADDCNGLQLADYLREIAEMIEEAGDFSEAAPMITDTIAGRTVIGVNGNTMGRWAVQTLSPQQVARNTAFPEGTR